MRETSAIGSSYQRTGVETAEREDSVCAVVNGRVCDSAIVVIAGCESPINPVIKPFSQFPIPQPLPSLPSISSTELRRLSRSRSRHTVS
jgi:hypothetical protein